MDPPTVVEQLECNGLEVVPIIAPLAFSFDGGSTTGLVLDAWTRIASVEGRGSSNLQRALELLVGAANIDANLVRLASRTRFATRTLTPDEFADLLSQRLLQKGRFGFDPGPAWNALDVGFSLNEHGVEVESSPATELLAAVGLQRFRPVMNDDRDGFDYFTWHSPLSAARRGGGDGRSDPGSPRRFAIGPPLPPAASTPRSASLTPSTQETTMSELTKFDNWLDDDGPAALSSANT